MADGFIVRKGGVAASQTAQPTITFVSSTTTSITFTLTNNDASTAVILWEVGDTTPDANSIELAASATSSNLTASGLTEGDIVTIYATANATGQIKSNVAELERGTTLATPTIAQVSKTQTSITFTVRNESNTAASVTYGLSSPPTTTTLELAANTTSASQTISGLTVEQTVTVFAQATKTLYGNSAIASSTVTTDPEVYALDFDGTDDFVDLGVPTLNIASAYTITALLKVDNISSAMAIVNGDNGASKRLWQFKLESNGVIRFIRFNSSNGVVANFTTSDRFDDNQFHSISVVFDSSVGSKIYVDGVEEASNGNTTANNSGAKARVTIGTYLDGTTIFSEFLNGFISNVQIWTKGLSSTEINNFITTLPTGNETSLFALYKFDEGTGTTLNDSAGSTNGTINGATWVTI